MPGKKVYWLGAPVLAAMLATTGLALAQPDRDGRSGPLRKPDMADTLKLNVYADNWFHLYINGKLVAVDSIRFLPHNVVSVDILPAYPMTIAVMAMDNADPETGMEYANTNIGDGGFILKLADGTVTDGSWKACVVSRGPLGGDTSNPRTENVSCPERWFAPEFDDSGWVNATVYSEAEVGPKKPFYDYDFQGARFIWGGDLKIDNTVLFRRTVTRPPDGVERPDFRGLNDVPMPSPGQRNRPR